MSNSLPTESSFVDSQGRPVSQKVAEELAVARLRIGTASIARRVWERMLSARERERLGGVLETCWRRYGTAGMWMQAKSVSREQAIVRVATGTNLMTTTTERWLLGVLGYTRSAPKSDNLPVWDATTGELRYRGRTVRQVRVNRRPSNIQQILHAFQKAGWPNRIRNPLGDDPVRLRQTLYALNDGLKTLRFSSQQGGRAVTWKIR